jgi:hypothetical protein
VAFHASLAESVAGSCLACMVKRFCAGALLLFTCVAVLQLAARPKVPSCCISRIRCCVTSSLMFVNVGNLEVQLQHIGRSSSQSLHWTLAITACGMPCTVFLLSTGSKPLSESRLSAVLLRSPLCAVPQIQGVHTNHRGLGLFNIHVG